MAMLRLRHFRTASSMRSLMKAGESCPRLGTCPSSVRRLLKSLQAPCRCTHAAAGPCTWAQASLACRSLATAWGNIWRRAAVGNHRFHTASTQLLIGPRWAARAGSAWPHKLLPPMASECQIEVTCAGCHEGCCHCSALVSQQARHHPQSTNFCARWSSDLATSMLTSST